MTIEMGKTGRGFAVGTFTDRYDQTCSIKESSLATSARIWLGIDNPNAKVMASEAAAHGLDPGDGTGWVDYPIPKGVLVPSHMHLTQEMVRALLPLLQHFADTGQLPRGP